MNLRTRVQTTSTMAMSVTLCFLSLMGCGIEVPDPISVDPVYERLEGVQLVRAAKLVRGSCAAICDAYAECGIAHETCHETCQKQEAKFVESRSLACAEAMTESYQCLEDALCPVDETTFLNDVALCELAYDDHIRAVCVPPPIAPDTAPERVIDPATKEVCSGYCERMADCGIATPEDAAGACLSDCIDSVGAMRTLEADLCGNPIVDALSCAQSLQCDELKQTSMNIWYAGVSNVTAKCADVLPPLARCTNAIAQGRDVSAAPLPVDLNTAVSVRTVASCQSLCALDNVCELGLATGRDTCVSECVSELDDSSAAAPVSQHCIEARIDLQYCLGRMTCGEFSDYMTAQTTSGTQQRCQTETDAITDHCAAF